MRLDTTSVQDNGDMPFSVDMITVMQTLWHTHKIGKFKAAIKNMSWQEVQGNTYITN